MCQQRAILQLSLCAEMDVHMFPTLMWGTAAQFLAALELTSDINKLYSPEKENTKGVNEIIKDIEEFFGLPLSGGSVTSEPDKLHSSGIEDAKDGNETTKYIDVVTGLPLSGGSAQDGAGSQGNATGTTSTTERSTPAHLTSDNNTSDGVLGDAQQVEQHPEGVRNGTPPVATSTDTLATEPPAKPADDTKPSKRVSEDEAEKVDDVEDGPEEEEEEEDTRPDLPKADIRDIIAATVQVGCCDSLCTAAAAVWAQYRAERVATGAQSLCTAAAAVWRSTAQSAWLQVLRPCMRVCRRTTRRWRVTARCTGSVARLCNSGRSCGAHTQRRNVAAEPLRC
jgi:hypothetical protein